MGKRTKLTAAAERLAAGLLVDDDREAVAADIADELRALHLGQLADRAGSQRGGGYVDPHQAADQLLAEVLQPYLDDLDRRATIGALTAATEIGFGLLLGLYSCRDEEDGDCVLTHAGMPDAVDNLAWQVMSAMTKNGLRLPRRLAGRGVSRLAAVSALRRREGGRCGSDWTE